MSENTLSPMMFYHPTSFENTGLNSFLVERPCIVLTFPAMAICKGVSSFVTDCPCSLQWRHNGRDSVSNHQPHDCLLNRLFKRRSKKTSKLRDTGLCAGNSPGTGEFPTQMANNAENVSIWWRHHTCLGPWIYYLPHVCHSISFFWIYIIKNL